MHPISIMILVFAEKKISFFYSMRNLLYSSLSSFYTKSSVIVFALFFLLLLSCKKNKENKKEIIVTPPAALNILSIKVADKETDKFINGISKNPSLKIKFSKAIHPATISASVTVTNNNGINQNLTTSISQDTTELFIQLSNLDFLTKYAITINPTLMANDGGKLSAAVSKFFATGIDSTRKFPALSTEQLLDKVQIQTLKYFWNFAHPVSGLAREGSKHSTDIVTSGGSGFGIMALIVAIDRGFKTKTEVLTRMQTIVSFLKNTAANIKGAFPHWMNGATGTIIPFGKNNGVDIVETSFLIQGLICARQYFKNNSQEEINLRNDISFIIDRVEWNWFTNANQNELYWQYNPENTGSNIWSIKVQGWNEALITYILAASSKNYSISKQVYDNGWARNAAMKNDKSFFNIPLPLGPDYGGPLFFEHYSFLGINPIGLSDAYANYETQAKNHTLINYAYCKTNPQNYFGYSDSVWGLTASNIKNGYTASAPTNDQGFIAPTAAISSLPYTPNESMAALDFYYYVLGDKLFKEYGFIDAFSLDIEGNNDPWFSDAFLAIDQGPIIVMIENFRTQLLWKLFTGCSEIKSGMQKLGFTAPYL